MADDPNPTEADVPLPSLNDVRDMGHADAARLKALGSSTRYQYDGPSADILEVFPNPAPMVSGDGKEYEIIHETKEFTSLCPKTGQPDFARIQIILTPDKTCVESKSLKLYLGAYRNTGAFMERITNQIRDDLMKVTDPIGVTVTSYFRGRGGIKTSVRAVYRRTKKDLDRMMSQLRTASEQMSAAVKDIHRQPPTQVQTPAG
jgi:7-cyano-7-deazaguanine reductase